MRLLSTLLCFSLISSALCAEKPPTPPADPAGFNVTRDLNYAGTENWRQTLDIIMPKDKPEKPLPLVVYIHGGGWIEGNKLDIRPLLPLLQDKQFIGASLNYRLTNEGTHPIQINDCKAAIRFLRANAAKYSIDPEKIGIYGISAGGHLVSLLGTDGDTKTLEGKVGKNLDQSSKVNCVIDFCGPTNFLTFGGQGSIIDPAKGDSVVGKLLGGSVPEKTEVAKSASPVNYVTKGDAPFLHIHGTKDTLVPLGQAKEFHEALKKAEVPTTLLIGEGGGHVFGSADLVKKMRGFLDQYLLGTPASVESGPVATR